MPADPPEPILPSDFVSVIKSYSPAPAWVSSGVRDPSAAWLGTIKSSTTTIHLCHSKNGAIGADKWVPTSSPPTSPSGSANWGLLLTEADAAKILAAGSSVNASGQLVSGGVTYTARQCAYSNGQVLFRLV
jgi:hypothetical protein